MSADNRTPEDVTGKVTSDGARFVARFLDAQKDLEHARNKVNSAECELHNAESALARWLAPPDIKPGEKIGVWVSDSLLLVEMVKRESYSADGNDLPHIDYDYKVTVRTRGKNHWRLT